MSACVGVLIFNIQGEMLLQFRNAQAPTNPHKWGFFGGVIEEGEDAWDCAVRETAEELEVEIHKRHLECVGILEKRDGGRLIILKYMHPVGWSDIVVCEGAGAGFFSKEDALKLPLTPGTRMFLER